MATVLVHAELDGGRPSLLALAALGEARRIASALGASLYALLTCAEAPSYGENDVVSVLGQHGADKVVLLTSPGLGKPLLFATHGPAVVAACERLRPALLLFPCSPGGRDLAPRVAARLGAAFAARPRIDIRPHGVTLFRPIFGGACERMLSIEDLERPVVLTYEGTVGSPHGQPDAEVVVLAAPAIQAAISELPAGGVLPVAEPPVRLIVLAGAVVLPDPLAARMAAMGVRVIPEGTPVTGDPGAPVVAVGRDPEHPIFEQARWGVVGEPGDVLERLAHALGAPA